MFCFRSKKKKNLQKGKRLYQDFARYLCHLEKATTHPDLPEQLYHLGLYGLRKHTGYDFDEWNEMIIKWERTLKDKSTYAHNNFMYTINNQIVLFEKMFLFINQVHFESENFINSFTNECVTRERFENKGKKLIREIVNWLKSLLIESENNYSLKNNHHKIFLQ